MVVSRREIGNENILAFFLLKSERKKGTGVRDEMGSKTRVAREPKSKISQGGTGLHGIGTAGKGKRGKGVSF